MKRYHHLCFFVFLLLHQIAIAQTIQGRLIDDKTNQGIAYASIGILGTNEATISNENGDFELKVKLFPLKLRVSHVSYLITDLTFTQYHEEITIKLKQASLNLKEVVIGPNQAEKLLTAALKKAKENSGNYVYGNGFYRQLSTINDKPSEIYELFYDLKLNTERVKGWLAKQSRYATSKENARFTISNQSFLTFIFSGMLLPAKSGKSIHLETIKDYAISIDRIIDQTDQQIAVITCRLKKPYKRAMYVNSTYYIGINDSNIYRLENHLSNLPNDFKESEVKPAAFTTISTFKSNANAVPILESIATKLNIALVSDKQPYNINVTSLLNVYRIDSTIKKQDFVSLNVNIKDKQIIESIQYNADFWKDNPIVKQTTLEDSFIRMMESKSAFGTMTNL